MKKLIISVAMMALLSCQSLDIPAPDAQVNCTIATTTHPKHAAYQGLLDRYTAQGIPGLNLLLDHPVDGCWQGAAGYADVEAGIPLSPCHRMITASLIKSYIAVIVLQLAEEGKLSLEDQLTPYLDEKLLRRIPNGQTATIRQLLQCRSGMPDVFETDFLLDFLNQPTRQYSMEELMRYLYGVKPAAAPGERFYYGDGNFILLSMLIEKVDAPLKESYQTRIFDRLGSTDAFLVEQPDELPTQVPASYWDRYGNGVLENVSDIQTALIAGLAGTDGVVSSLSDLASFMDGLRKGVLLSAASYQEMVDVIAIPDGQSQQNYVGYGLGIGQVKVSGETWYGSFGNHVGSAAMMLYNPTRQTTLIMAQNVGTFFNDAAKQRFFYELIVEVEKIAFE